MKLLKRFTVLLLLSFMPLLAPSLASAQQIERDSLECSVSSIDQINACIQADAKYIALTQDITCTTGNCQISIFGRNNINLDGRGFTITRLARTKDNPVLFIKEGSSDIAIENITFDERGNTDICPVFCNRSIFVYGAKDIFFTKVNVLNSRSYALYVQRTDGFSFRNGSVQDSGVLGMYVGLGFGGETTRRLTVVDNEFLRNATNGLAVHGIAGTGNLITGNLFVQNHLFGRFAESNGKFIGGGQLYVAGANGLLVDSNRVIDGSCSNCRDPLGSVHGIELGELNVKSVTNTVISNNTLTNNDNCALIRNPSSTLDATTQIFRNTFSGNRCDLKAAGATIYDNIFN